MDNTLTRTELAKYLGPSVISANDYQSHMWRIESDNEGRSSIVKCSRETNCILYYVDSNGVEHRDGIFSVNQLPVNYRTIRYSKEDLDNVNTNTKITYDLLCLLFGKPETDPDIPFIYKWVRGEYVLETTGSSFVLTKIGDDSRETVNIIGNLPLSFKQVLDSQVPAADSKQLVEKTVAYELEAPLEVLVPESFEDVKVEEKVSKTKTKTKTRSKTKKQEENVSVSLELSLEDAESALKVMGMETLLESEDEYKTSLTIASEDAERSWEEQTIKSDRKAIVSDVEPSMVPDAPEGFIESLLAESADESGVEEEITETEEVEVKKTPAKKTSAGKVTSKNGKKRVNQYG